MGSERGKAHQNWFKLLAAHYDFLYDSQRVAQAYPFLHDLFRRRGPVSDVLDVACGTFALDLPLVRRGYRVVGRDLSPDMLRVARANLAKAGLNADVGRSDMRSLRIERMFDAIVCLGTAFNYLTRAADVRRALRSFRSHLRPRGILVLDLTNFDAWIRRPTNARAETDYRARDGTRVAVYAFNAQDPRAELHLARMITVVQRGRRVDLAFDEAPLKIWTKEALGQTLRRERFRPVEWWGDLRLGRRYEKAKSPRLVAVAIRE